MAIMEASATRLQSYWRATRSPRYSLLFALPLLVFYEILAVLVAAGPDEQLRNGADVLLRAPFIALLGVRGPLVFEVSLIGIGLWLVIRDLRAHRSRLSRGVFAGMLGESLALAAVVGIVVGGITAKLLSHVALSAQTPMEHLGPWPKLMLSLGAGLYEELLFRVILVGALAWAGQRLLGWRPLVVGIAAVVAGAIIFSAFHYVGPYGDRLEPYSFVYRMMAGLFFSAVYLSRGFGITAWTHALYDVFVLIR